MMDFLIQNSWSILQLSLSVFLLGLIIFLIPILFRVFKLLGIINELALTVQNITGLVQTYLWAPAKFFLSIKGAILPMINKIVSALSKK